jgi:hypothetical protein
MFERGYIFTAEGRGSRCFQLYSPYFEHVRLYEFLQSIVYLYADPAVEYVKQAVACFTDSVLSAEGNNYIAVIFLT